MVISSYLGKYIWRKKWKLEIGIENLENLNFESTLFQNDWWNTIRFRKFVYYDVSLGFANLFEYYVRNTAGYTGYNEHGLVD